MNQLIRRSTRETCHAQYLFVFVFLLQEHARESWKSLRRIFEIAESMRVRYNWQNSVTEIAIFLQLS